MMLSVPEISSLNLNVLTVQSAVAYGYVGNNAAVPVLNQLGVTTYALSLVAYSNSTIYPTFRGMAFTPDQIRMIFSGLVEREVLPDCHAILTGFMGSSALGSELLAMVTQLKQANPRGLYFFDPVMGSKKIWFNGQERGYFASEEIRNYMRDVLLNEADVVMPNHKELEFLSNIPLIDNLETAVRAARGLLNSKQKVVFVKSLRFSNQPDHIYMIVVSEKNSYKVKMNWLDLPMLVNGAGDVTSAIFVALFLANGNDLGQVLKGCADRIYSLLKFTLDQKATVLQLIPGLKLLINPNHDFRVEEVSLTSEV